MKKCNHVVIRSSFAYNFFLFSSQAVKMGKVLASDGSYVTLYDLLSVGFFTGSVQQDFSWTINGQNDNKTINSWAFIF